MEPDDEEELAEEVEDEEVPVDELLPNCFGVPIPPPEEDLDPPDPPLPEPIGDLALEEGGVPGNWPC